MSLKVVPYKGITTLDIECDKILEAAKSQLSLVVVIGFDKKGELYAASSTGSDKDVIWLMKKLEHELISGSFREK